VAQEGVPPRADSPAVSAASTSRRSKAWLASQDEDAAEARAELSRKAVAARY
jgi:hypothetical protein